MGAEKSLKGKIRRNAFIGRGSPLDQIFVTREAIDAVKKDKDWSFLKDLMAFIGAPEIQIFDETRAAHRRLDTNKPVMSLPFRIKKLKRTFDMEAKQFK